MIRLPDKDSVYLDESVAGFTKQLAADGVVERQVDLLLVGVAYAITERLDPMETIHRHDLNRVAAMDPDVRLVLEASLVWYVRENNLSQPATAKDLLDLLARVGSAGIAKLRKESGALSLNQLRSRLVSLVSGN